MKHLLLLITILLTVHLHAQFTGLPVTLSQPYDREVLEDNEPLLVWQTDLSTVIDNPRVAMRLTIAEIKQDQTPTEAMQINAPILLRDELKSNTWSYSSTDTELLPGHHYAWQVTISYNQVIVQQSEVWEFSIRMPVPPLSAFHPVKLKQDGAIYSLLDNRLNIALTSSKELPTAITIVNAKGVEIKKTLQELVDGKFADETTSKASSSAHYFSVDLKDLNKGLYTMHWLADGKIYQLTFRR